ncbi:hypothetical protein ACTXT7_003413 [Hymenolepis weldensis]
MGIDPYWRIIDWKRAYNTCDSLLNDERISILSHQTFESQCFGLFQSMQIPGVQFKSSCDPLPGIVPLDPYESLTEVQVLVVLENSLGEEVPNLGQYVVNWRRGTCMRDEVTQQVKSGNVDSRRRKSMIF